MNSTPDPAMNPGMASPAVCTSCTKPITAEVSALFNGVCPWCLAAFVEPEAKTHQPEENDAALKRYFEARSPRNQRGVPVREKARDVPPEMASIVERCLAFNAEDRYQSMAEMLKDMRRFRKGEPVLAHSVGWAYRAWKFVARRRIKVAAVLLAVTASVGLWRLEASRLDAVAVLESALWTRVGEERLDRGDDAGARDAFTRVIEIRPTAKAYLDRTFVHWRLRDYRSCLADVSLALALDPANPAAARTMATVTAFASIR